MWEDYHIADLSNMMARGAKKEVGGQVEGQSGRTKEGNWKDKTAQREGASVGGKIYASENKTYKMKVS